MGCYAARRLDIRGGWIPSINNNLMMNHFAGGIILYGTSDGRYATDETLAQIDIDCHGRGSREGARACVEWLEANGFPGLFWSHSTDGVGIHAYFRLGKRGVGDQGVVSGLTSLQQWLRIQFSLQQWDISGIEVMGTPPVMNWGDDKYELLGVTMGKLMKLPVDAYDRPAELMTCCLKTVKELGALGLKAWELSRSLSLSIPTPCLTPTEIVAEYCDEIDVEEIKSSGWTPDRRNGEWPRWVEYVAREGLQDEDDLGSVIHELATWLLWVEMYEGGAHDRDNILSSLCLSISNQSLEDNVAEMLTKWVMAKHNDNVTRLSDGKVDEVESQIRRAVKSATSPRCPHSLEIFANIRRKRKNGGYVRLINIAHLLVDGAGEEDQKAHDGGNILSSLCLTLRDDHLPDEIETKLLQTTQRLKMRRHNGEYPLIRFARHLLNHLWDSKGSARLSTETLNQMAEATKPNQQVKYKTILHRLGLIESWEGTHLSRAASSRYTMTRETRAAFEARYTQQHQSLTA